MGSVRRDGHALNEWEVVADEFQVVPGDKIVFKLNDPGRRLPSPFPVLEQWTRFNEDQTFD